MQQSIRTLAISSLLAPVLTVMPMMASAESPMPPVEHSTTAAPSTTAKVSLMSKLKQLAHFSADFTQNILDANGELLQQGTGNLSISKPNLVNWQTTAPDETLIISDGATLWFYDPFIEQASAYSLSDSIANTPILLLTSDDPQLWQQYDVVAINAADKTLRFDVLPKAQDSQIKKLSLAFVKATTGKVSELSEFSFQDSTGQISQIILSNFNSQTQPNSDLFSFTLPEGVRLEDKR